MGRGPLTIRLGICGSVVMSLSGSGTEPGQNEFLYIFEVKRAIDIEHLSQSIKFIDVMKWKSMHDKCERSNAKDTKADEVCTNKCPNKKKHIHNKMI